MIPMAREDLITAVRQDSTEYIRNILKLEGFNISYSQTEKILYSSYDSGISIHTIVRTVQLKHAFRFLFATLDTPMDLNLLLRIHRYAGGYADNIANTGLIQQHLTEITSIDDRASQGVLLFYYLLHNKLFKTRNKRTAVLAADHILIAEGIGIIHIPSRYRARLIDLAQSDDYKAFRKFVFRHCIEGLDSRI